jgi:hypothetical protein
MTPTNVFWIRPRRHNVGNETIAYALRRLLRAELGPDVNLLPVAPRAVSTTVGWPG